MSKKSGAFTVTELLVVLSVASIMMGLLLPAVQTVRESARNLQCQSNLRQLGIAIANHESIHRALPGGGWGFRWVGESGWGQGRSQPGGWIYQLLPQLELSSLSDLSAHDKLLMVQQKIPTLVCPSRPLQNPAPYLGTVTLVNMAHPELAFRNDYAGNGGDVHLRSDGGPHDSEAYTLRHYPWEHLRQATGVFFQYSQIRYRDVPDGLSNTYGIGEKYAMIRREDPRDLGNDQCALIGDDHDIRRVAAVPPLRDGTFSASDAFGSSHHSTWNALRLDGSVSAVDFSIDLSIHKQLGNRSDGKFGISQR